MFSIYYVFYRRIVKRSGFHVVSLKRTKIAGIISVESLPDPGSCRWLSHDEENALKLGLGMPVV